MPAGVTTMEMVLISAIGTGLLGIGSLITWVIKSLVPKVLALMEERNRTLVEAVDRMGRAVDDFEKSLDQHGDRIVGEIKTHGDKVLSEVKVQGDRLAGKIDDKRFEELRAEVRKLGPDESGGHGIPPSVKVTAKR